MILFARRRRKPVDQFLAQFRHKPALSLVITDLVGDRDQSGDMRDLLAAKIGLLIEKELVWTVDQTFKLRVIGKKIFLCCDLIKQLFQVPRIIRL